jgi:hypothetical protein
VDLHQHGCISPTFADRTCDVKTGKEVFDKHYRGTPAGPISYRQLTLDERIDDIENALRVNTALTVILFTELSLT